MPSPLVGLKSQGLVFNLRISGDSFVLTYTFRHPINQPWYFRKRPRPTTEYPLEKTESSGVRVYSNNSFRIPVSHYRRTQPHFEWVVYFFLPPEVVKNFNQVLLDLNLVYFIPYYNKKFSRKRNVFLSVNESFTGSPLKFTTNVLGVNIYIYINVFMYIM